MDREEIKILNLIKKEENIMEENNYQSGSQFISGQFAIYISGSYGQYLHIGSNALVEFVEEKIY